MIIYKITNKIYIGQTTGDLIKRWKAHIRASKKIKFPLYNAIKKYKLKNFNIGVIDICYNIDELNAKERYWIKFYNSINNGYNCRNGGYLNSLLSYKTKQKISKALKGNKNGKNQITSLDIIKKRLKNKFGDIIKIKDSSYKGVTIPAIFIDKKYGEFKGLFGNIIRYKYGHRKRIKKFKKPRKIDPKEINKKFKKNRNEIRLIESSYKGMLSKAKFIDKDFGIFSAYAVNVIHHNTGHIKRAVINREITKIKKGRYNAKKFDIIN